MGQIGESALQLLIQLAKEYRPIAGEIKAAKWARLMRNQISFHYDPRQAIKSVAGIDDEHRLEITAGAIHGITLFNFAEEIVSTPIFSAAGNGDAEKGMEVANQFIVRLVNSITHFHVKTTLTLFGSVGMEMERVKHELRDAYCAVPGEVRIPISVSTAYLSSRPDKKKTSSPRKHRKA